MVGLTLGAEVGGVGAFVGGVGATVGLTLGAEVGGVGAFVGGVGALLGAVGLSLGAEVGLILGGVRDAIVTQSSSQHTLSVPHGVPSCAYCCWPFHVKDVQPPLAAVHNSALVEHAVAPSSSPL